MQMYIRFIIPAKDEDSGKRMGLFQAFGELRDAGILYHYEEDQLIKIRDWFNENLEKPSSFSRSRKPHAQAVAISWFKDTAKIHLAKMYEFAAILKSHGYAVEVIRTERIGYIVYEDEYQATAEPYSDTPT